MKKLLFILFVFFISISCHNTVEKAQIFGVWIEATHKSDTLDFENPTKGFGMSGIARFLARCKSSYTPS